MSDKNTVYSAQPVGEQRYNGRMAVNLTSITDKIGLLIRNRPLLLILGAALLAYHGVLLLGISMDDFGSLYRWQSAPWMQLARSPANNRFPLFALFIYPLLLQMPWWLSHLLIVAVHTLSAILLFRLLIWFDLGEMTATIAALLFLLWPALVEALLWIVASTVVFGVCLVLVGTVLLTRGRLLPAFALVFIGITFSEGILLPALFLQLVVLLRRRSSISKLLPFLGGIVGLYGAFQLSRLLVSVSTDGFTQYAVGLAHALSNLRDLVVMSLDLASSRDVAWMWQRAVKLTNVGLLLPAQVLLVAVMIVLPATLAAQALDPGAMAQRKPRNLLKIIAVALLGYGSALLIFALVTGNFMQSRYTYTAVAYLVVLLAVPLGWLSASRRRVFVQIGLICTVVLLSWSMYRVWSNIWANWYPAKELSARLIADIRQTYQETGAPKIILVNPPESVGNAYSISRIRGYEAITRMYIDPQLEIGAEDITTQLLNNELSAGSRFSEKPCVFLGWQNGKRIVGKRALDPYKKLLLDCESGMVEAAPKGVTVPIIYHYSTNGSRESLSEVFGRKR